MRRSVITILSIFILVLLFPLTCFAWTPSVYHICYIEHKKIPENAVYVDLLLPISTQDANYTPYHTANGELFGIASESEIIKYNEDGYMSYTFHLQDAQSEMRPHYVVSFICDETIYNNNQALFEQAGLTKYSVLGSENRSRRYLFNTKIYLGSEADMAMEQICALVKEHILAYRKNIRVCFFSLDSETVDFKAYTAFCQKYQHAKMAYLDQDGNIISTSNPVSIFKKDRLNRSIGCDTELIGNELSSDISYGPPFFLLLVPVFLIPVAATVIIIISIAKIVLKKFPEKTKVL